ncbi:METTL5 family protein [Candidatus Bathyarchaeota archaeon]|nr:METTL5 family protein [Candidatus Bathyarchaeota archaeon]
MQQLEIVLSHLEKSPSPKFAYEAYDLNPAAASEILFLAETRYGDLKNRSILDLGCGSGILAIGAALLGAKEVVGIDINSESVEAAKRNANLVQVVVDFIAGDIEAIRGAFDVTVMNPPFGTRKKGVDAIFLQKAMSVSKRVYSLHKRGEQNRIFLRNRVESLSGSVDAVFEIGIEIAKTYEFHKKRRYAVDVDLYRVVVNSHSRSDNVLK